VGNLWRLRRARATHLLAQTPHAEEILTFYVDLVDAQEAVAEGVPVVGWLELVRSPEGGDPDDSVGDFPWLHVERLPLDELTLPFRNFVSGLAELGTETIKDGARALISCDDQRREDALRGAVDAWGKADGAREQADETQRQPDRHNDFYARAFLEPVVTSIARADSAQPADWTQGVCFACGALPQVAVLQDLPDAVGHRGLTCSMCASEWRFPRLTCPNCGETEADKLPVHTAESIAHVRVDACTTCSRYVKTVDLREKGDAVPLVDELAAVELDVWAREQGLTKLRANVLGL
jgi:formate dehydrogenase maturation protein FdhE